jgi:DNA repair protein RadC
MSIFDGIVLGVVLIGISCLYVRIPCFFKHSMMCRLENGIIGLANRILLSRLKSAKKEAEPMTSPGAVKNYLSLKLAEKPYEVFCCLYLDNKHRVIEFKEMFYGTIDSASVYPREIVRHCIQVNAAALILAHNHPSGDPSPSAADRAITAKIKSALSLIDVRVLDHIIVGDSNSGIVSFAEDGYI